MARPATAQRPASRRPGRLDRPAQRHIPPDADSLPAPLPGSPCNDILLSTPAESPVGPPSSDLTPHTCWALLPMARRQQFELRLSRLVLKAARIPSLDTEENL
jgi:hypothetical protein